MRAAQANHARAHRCRRRVLQLLQAGPARVADVRARGQRRSKAALANLNARRLRQGARERRQQLQRAAKQPPVRVVRTERRQVLRRCQQAIHQERLLLRHGGVRQRREGVHASSTSVIAAAAAAALQQRGEDGQHGAAQRARQRATQLQQLQRCAHVPQQLSRRRCGGRQQAARQLQRPLHALCTDGGCRHEPS
jgi:hypothetical protein